MSVVGADPLRVLRERIVELITWFGDDGKRLPDAQANWRRDDLWDARVQAEVERWQAALAEGHLPPFAVLPKPGASAGAASIATPARVLFELECLDLLAWLAAGASRQAPPQPIGTGDRARYLIRLARERTPHTARQAGLLATHLRYHAIVPATIRCDETRSYRVRVRHMAQGVRRVEDARSRGRVSVATTSFGDDAPLVWREQAAVSVATADERAQKLSRAIEGAARGGVDILVAPELTLPPASRAEVIAALRWAEGAEQLALIVPGSFHERVAERTYNRAVLVDGRGNQLCEHLKLTLFGQLDGWLEEITPGEEITVLVTPIGTVAIAICKDFCDYHVGRVWQELQPEWLLVPAYGKGANAHEEAAARIARMVGTITILAHEGDRTLEAPQNSFVHSTRLTRINHTAPDYSAHDINISNDLNYS